jgi:hypothetical protein
MAGPCMCGDPNCPSCGFLLGANPEFEMVCEWLEVELLKGFSPAINEEWLVEELANRLEKSKLSDAVLDVASAWSREQRTRRDLGSNT